jgi:hypothetical protein
MLIAVNFVSLSHRTGGMAREAAIKTIEEYVNEI